MNNIGYFDVNGQRQSAEEIRKSRKKKGMCVNCGEVKTHKVFMGGVRTTPLTHEFAMDGKCLRCFPLGGSKEPNLNNSSYSNNITSAQSHRNTIAAPIAPVVAVSARQPRSTMQSNHSTSAYPLQSNNINPSQSSVSMEDNRPRSATSFSAPITQKRDSFSYKKMQEKQAQQQAAMQQQFNQLDITGQSTSFNAGTPGGRSSVNIASRSSVGSTGSESSYVRRNFIPEGSDGDNYNGNSAGSIRQGSYGRGNLGSITEFQQQQQMQMQPEEHPIETLKNIQRKSMEGQYARSGGNAANDVSRLMRKHSNQQGVQEESVKTLAMVGETQIQTALSEGKTGTALVDHVSDSIDSLIVAMRSNVDNTEIQEYACQALWTLTVRPEVQLAVANAGGLRAIVEGMGAHPNRMKLQLKCCATLNNLSSHEDIWRSLGQCGAIQAMLRAMNKYILEDDLLNAAIGALANLTVSEGNRNILVGSTGGGEGLNIIVDVMATHGKNAKLQEQIIKILRNCSAGNEANKTAIIDAGGLDTLVSVMKTHPQNVAVQETSCWAISNLAVVKKLKPVIGESGAVQHIVDAMWELEQNSGMQEWGCRALWSLSVDSQNKVLIGECFGIDAIVNAMTIHVNNKGVQEKACGALSNLAANNEQNKIAIVEAEGIDAVKHAMETHPSVEGVQEKGCLALRKLTTESTLPFMSCLDIKPILEHASRTFPAKCSDRAGYVLTKLEALYQ